MKGRKICSFTVNKAFTYADMRGGYTDKEKREYIRSVASKRFPVEIPSFKYWGIRIKVGKSGKRPFDIENVPKLYVDSFCKKQIKKDKSKFTKVGLYEDDKIDYFKLLEITGDRSNKDFTEVEIIGWKD